MRFIFLSAFLLFASACTNLPAPAVNAEAAALREGQYKLDTAHATLLFKVKHFGISSYVGRFNTFDATLDFDPDNASAGRIDALIDVASLDVNNPSFAEKLTGPNWFDAAAYPQARFISTDIIITGENTGVAKGDLTLKGVTKPVDLNITFNGGTRNPLTTRYTIGFDGIAQFNRSDFGVDKFIGIVGDKVVLEFYGEFQRQ